jgi:glycyl-tRNA synthetase beta chain
MVSNLAPHDSSAIVHGNERVLRARLADARFFFDQDRREPLASRVESLRAIVYHNKLGSLGDRVERLRFLARNIGRASAPTTRCPIAPRSLRRPTSSRTWSASFPNCREQWAAITRSTTAKRHRSPTRSRSTTGRGMPATRFPKRPSRRQSRSPTSSKRSPVCSASARCPPATRIRSDCGAPAIGVLRILIEKRLNLPLPSLLGLSFQAFNSVVATKPVPEDVADFLYDRLRGHLREQGYTANQVEAVLVQRPSRIDLVPDQLAAVKAFEALPESGALSAANKRIVNILKKSGGEAAAGIDVERLTDGAERDLWQSFEALTPAIEQHCTNGDYTSALKALASAKPAVDRFFDDVMVMADDEALRANRLALLNRVAATMNRVADISKLAA